MFSWDNSGELGAHFAGTIKQSTHADESNSDAREEKVDMSCTVEEKTKFISMAATFIHQKTRWEWGGFFDGQNKSKSKAISSSFKRTSNDHHACSTTPILLFCVRSHFQYPVPCSIPRSLSTSAPVLFIIHLFLELVPFYLDLCIIYSPYYSNQSFFFLRGFPKSRLRDLPACFGVSMKTRLPIFFPCWRYVKQETWNFHNISTCRWYPPDWL